MITTITNTRKLRQSESHGSCLNYQRYEGISKLFQNSERFARQYPVLFKNSSI